MKTSSPGPRTRARRFRTRRSIIWGDRVMRFLVSLGGLGTVLSVLTVCGFLIAVASPLFLAGSARSETRFSPGPVPRALAVDAYRRVYWQLLQDGSVQVRRCDDGALVSELELAAGQTITSVAHNHPAGLLACGFASGQLQLFELEFHTSYPSSEANPALADLARGERRVTSWLDLRGNSRQGLVEHLEQGGLRGLSLELRSQASKSLGSAPVQALGLGMAGDAPVICALLQAEEPAQRLKLVRSRRQENRLTGQSELRLLRTVDLAWPEDSSLSPEWLRVGAYGRQVYLLQRDGRGLRYRFSPPRDVLLAESIDLCPDSDASLTCLEWVLGGETLISGHSDGSVRGWFVAPPAEHTEDWWRITSANMHWLFTPGSAALDRFERTGTLAETVVVQTEGGDLPLAAPDRALITAYQSSLGRDGSRLVGAKQLAGPSGRAVTSLAASERTRLISAGFDDGTIKIFQVTSEGEVLAVTAQNGRGVEQLVLTPKDDGLFALSAATAESWRVDLAYPEAGWRSLFRPLHYEGYAEPEAQWQSSSGDDASEPKLSLLPLIFGTVKATIYSLLFGVPLALLAAIYTSEHLEPKKRGKIKTCIEMMASLPSVVLGFVAALVIAPWVASRVSGVLASFFTVPLLLMAAGCAWQLLPMQVALKLRRLRTLLMFGAMPCGVWLALSWIGPVVEDVLFLGDIQSYLNGARLIPHQGERFGGWLFVTLPLAGLAVWLLNYQLNPVWRSWAVAWSRRRAAVFELGRFCINLVLLLSVAGLCALLLSSWGDLRGPTSLLDTYIQRNALIVGGVMGFAIIPIIYTLAEDALAAVPTHLRWASLAAGATPWQTAMRVVVPTATGGLFSAVMVGLGRALGETMLVLMAAGNTPIMSWNIFNGFRTLSANIATELPEAVAGSSHYRTLFLSALLLFAMTFVLNTAAESIRQRYRRKVSG